MYLVMTDVSLKLKLKIKKKEIFKGGRVHICHYKIFLIWSLV